jgi:Uma2 family endonuclease
MTQNFYRIPQTDLPLSAKLKLPTMYDLKSEDPEEPGLPDEYHDLQPQLLSRTFRCLYYSPTEIFTGSDLNLYYDVSHTQWYKRPDWFLVVGVERLYEGTDLRSSYVVWQEGVNPFVVVELLSPGTENEDLGKYADVESISNIEIVDNIPTSQTNGQTTTQTPPKKWEVYEQILQVPYYIVFSRYTNQVRFFKLVDGHYTEQILDAENPRLWITELEVGVGLWLGEFEGITRQWLRWYDREGNWIPTDTELAQQQAQQERLDKELAQQQVEQERLDKELAQQQAQQAQAQLQQVALNLLQSGMSVEQVMQLTGLAEERVRQLAQ